MTQQEAKELVRNLLVNASDRQSFFENVSAKDVIEVNKLENVDEEIIEDAIWWLRQIAEEKQAICESRESDKILEFRPLFKFPVEFIELRENGEVHGAYYRDGELVAELSDGQTIELN